ncbi:glycoside hydrolase superfamily [Xylariaceae sp. FL0016]|nr:glycoside hydrolase superfamily [Xylariaceae sp. FL0016]
MKTFSALATLAEVASLATGALAASSWPGSNLYYAAGLNTTQQDYLFSGLKEAGVKVLRVWLDGHGTEEKGTPLESWNSLEGTDGPGNYDDTVLNRLDDLMVNAQSYGIKLWISMHSYNTLQSNNDFYGLWYGTGSFYSDSEAITNFKNRIAHVLSHENSNTGKTWAESSEYIFGFEAQNEADQPNNVPNSMTSWQCTMAQAIKDGLGGSGDILVGTGGGGWVDTSLPDALFSCDALDVLAIHAYGAGDMTTDKLSPYVTKAQDAGKKLIVQEWGACYNVGDENNKCNVGDALDSSTRDANIKKWADAISSAGIPWWYWQILPNEDPHYGADFEIGIDGVNWDTFKSVATGTSDYTAAFDFTQWLP